MEISETPRKSTIHELAQDTLIPVGTTIAPNMDQFYLKPRKSNPAENMSLSEIDRRRIEEVKEIITLLGPLDRNGDVIRRINDLSDKPSRVRNTRPLGEYSLVDNPCRSTICN
jgi:hypothetical protein